MYRFWSVLIQPVFDVLRPRKVVEVGSDFGHNTRHLAAWCAKHGAVVHVVDPAPKYDVDEWTEQYGDSIVFHRSLSLNALGRIGPADILLIDGDHNWFTVHSELQLAARQARKAAASMPVVFLHDVLWPYGRRDLYYDPETIPEAYRQPHARRGMRPGTPELLERGGINAHLWNSIYENDLRNGVMTAVEDFLADNDEVMEFLLVPAVHGLAVILPKARLDEHPALRDLVDQFRLPDRVRDLVEMVESERIESVIELQEHKHDARETAEQRRVQIGELQDKLRAQTERARDFEAGLREERTAHAEAQRALELEAGRREALGTAHDDLRRRVAEFERASERDRAETERLRAEAQGLRKELADGARRRRGLERRYRRLAERRAVRLALWMAGFARPLFWIARRVRRRSGSAGTAGPSTEQGKRDKDSEPEAVPAPEVVPVLDVLSRWPPVTVIVPVYNAADAVERCLESLARNSARSVQVLVIDDCSTEPSLRALLAGYAGRPGFRVLRNDKNLGFVRTVNRGVSESDGDVVLLNSDTEVPPNWLRNLRMAAYRHPDVGTVTPLSTNAGVFSAPHAAGDNRWPQGLSFDEAARLVARSGEPVYPQTPTGHGFCLYVRRAVFDEVGLLDAEAFPRGYGEETDLCMRAAAAGFSHFVDDRTYVFHERGSSFGADRDALIRSSRKVIDERYPQYAAEVASFKLSPELQRARRRVEVAFRRDTRAARARVLYVMHTGAGGTPQTNLDLMEALQHRYETLLLTSDGRQLRLFEVSGRECVALDAWKLDRPWQITDVTREDYRRIIADVLWRYDIALVHIRHLLSHTLDAPEVSKRFGVPVVLSLHDFYLSCPTIHLLDNEDRYCGGVCTLGRGACRIPTQRLKSAPPLKHAWVYEWRHHVGETLRSVDAFVTTSEHTRTVYEQSYPDVAAPFHVIEHGRDLVQRQGLATQPNPGGTVRILVPGNLGANKGANLIAELADVDRQGRLEFHFLGATPEGFDRYGVVHGTYERQDFDRRVGEIAPSFIGIFSIWPETYSHTLTEAWAAGVPVLATDIGVLRERISAHGGGWLLDYTDPQRMYRQILRIADDPEGYARQAARANLDGIRTTADMSKDYAILYGAVLNAATLGGGDVTAGGDGFPGEEPRPRLPAAPSRSAPVGN